MSWLFSQALVEEYLGDTSLDGEQSVPLNGNNTQQAYCAPDKMTKFSRLSRFGMTYKLLTETRGEELLTLYLADFHAKTLAQRGGGGITGSRSSMWKHMARIIGEVRPKYAFVENSPMLTTRGLGVVLADLSTLGFDAKWGVVSAADIGANHQRERIWIRAEQRDFLSHTQHDMDGWRQQQSESTQETIGLADSNSLASKIRGNDFANEEISRKWNDNHPGSGSNDFGKFDTQENDTMADSNCKSRRIMEVRRTNINDCQKRGNLRRISDVDERELQKQAEQILADSIEHGTQSQSSDTGKSSEWIDPSGIGNRNWWAIEPNVGRVANGVAARVDRLKAIGNGQVPLCAATAWELLK